MFGQQVGAADRAVAWPLTVPMAVGGRMRESGRRKTASTSSATDASNG